jgi:putative Mg2+ transporter-C (MgtC) family protein
MFSDPIATDLLVQIQQVALAAVLGLLMGIERAWRHKVASLRTFSMISVGACVFAIMSAYGSGSGDHDPTRIAAQIVTGVGFLGGGVIFKTPNRVEGITTAAMIWLVAAIGACCGFGLPFLAVAVVLIWAALNILSLSLHRFIDVIQGGTPAKPAATPGDFPAV